MLSRWHVSFWNATYPFSPSRASKGPSKGPASREKIDPTEQTQRDSAGSNSKVRLNHFRELANNKLYRNARPPWSPSFSVAFRILLLVRVVGAMYSNIDDCDEGLSRIIISSNVSLRPVFNFWEPLHFLQRGYGFQTWEASPRFAIRSWAYILLHLPIAQLGDFISAGQKVKSYCLLIHPSKQK